MLQGMLSCEQAHQNAGISMPNCSDACMCDRGRSTDLDEVWHVHCRNMEVLALEVMTLKIGSKRDKWIQQHKPQRARMGWVQSSKCCYPKNIATLQRPVQSQFFRWVNCSFFQLLVMQEERLFLEKRHSFIFCQSLSYPKDCSAAVRSRAMSVQASRKRDLKFTQRGQATLTSHFACLSTCESVTNLICSLAFVCQTLKLTLGQKVGYSTISGTVKYLTSSIKMLFCIILSYFYSFTRCCFLSNTDISLLLPTSKIPPSNAVHPVVAFSGEGRPASLLLTFSDLAATDSTTQQANSVALAMLTPSVLSSLWRCTQHIH